MSSLENRLEGSKKIVFLTGAGISQESGIATFRGKDGLWKQYDPMKFASRQAFMDDPKLVWSWYNDRRREILAANPNQGHVAIANVQNHRHVSVITQNIDGLHQRAGSRDVMELHGNIFGTKCTKCDFKFSTVSEFVDLPVCDSCGSILRPDVVWFGEGLKQAIWDEAVVHSMNCDMMIIVGTSLTVSPANSLLLYAKKNHAILVELNPEESPFSDEMDYCIRKTATEGLPILLSIFGRLKP
jgi:NAD-dependent deacetylase